MTTAKVVETSVTTNTNSPSQDCTNLDDLQLQTFYIYFPSGSIIKIDEFHWGISVYLSVTDLGEGLCRGIDAIQKTTKSLFNFTSSMFRSTSKHDTSFCSCSAFNTVNVPGESCSFIHIPKPLADLEDITKRIIDKQNILLKGFSFKEKANLRHNNNLQADGPIQSLSFETKEDICHKMLNASASLRVCKDIVDKQLWQPIWQICLQESEVEYKICNVKYVEGKSM